MTHLSYNGLTRIETDETVIATLKRKGWVEFTPAPEPTAPEPVPASVTNAQFRRALIRAGVMPAQVLAAIQAISDTLAREDALALWEYANTVERNQPLIAQLAPAFGLTDSQVDDLFKLAATL